MVIVIMMVVMVVVMYLAGLDGEAEVLEDLNIGSGRVPEIDVPEFNGPLHALRRGPRQITRIDLGLAIKDCKHGGGRRFGLARVRRQPARLRQRDSRHRQRKEHLQFIQKKNERVKSGIRLRKR